MSKFEFNNCSVIIQDGTIEKQYGSNAGEVYAINEPWIQPFRTCRFCKKPVSDEIFARAFYKLEEQYCSSECISKENIKKYACCEQAEINNCVCVFSIKCPVHGEKHFGSHE